MIGNYRSKKEIEALRWDGENKQELEDFVGKENIEWTFYSNDYPVPDIKGAYGDDIGFGCYIVIEERSMVAKPAFRIYSKNNFEAEYEKVM